MTAAADREIFMPGKPYQGKCRHEYLNDVSSFLACLN